MNTCGTTMSTDYYTCVQYLKIMFNRCCENILEWSFYMITLSPKLRYGSLIHNIKTCATSHSSMSILIICVYALNNKHAEL